MSHMDGGPKAEQLEGLFYRKIDGLVAFLEKTRLSLPWVLLYVVVLALVRTSWSNLFSTINSCAPPTFEDRVKECGPYAHFGAEASEKMKLMALQFLGMGRTPPMRARPL